MSERGMSPQDWERRVSRECLAESGPSEDRRFVEKLHERRERSPKVIVRRQSVPEIKPKKVEDEKTGKIIFADPGTPGLPSLPIAGTLLEIADRSHEAIEELVSERGVDEVLRELNAPDPKPDNAA